LAIVEAARRDPNLAEGGRDAVRTNHIAQSDACIGRYSTAPLTTVGLLDTHTQLMSCFVQSEFADTVTVLRATINVAKEDSQSQRRSSRRTSTVNTGIVSAAPPQEHLGSVEELDGYALVHRFDSVQLKSGTPKRLIEYLVHITFDGMKLRLTQTRTHTHSLSLMLTHARMV
jgi:hypothetical protein